MSEPITLQVDVEFEGTIAITDGKVRISPTAASSKRVCIAIDMPPRQDPFLIATKKVPDGATLKDFKQVGWTEAQLLKYGYAEYR